MMVNSCQAVKLRARGGDSIGNRFFGSDCEQPARSWSVKCIYERLIYMRIFGSFNLVACIFLQFMEMASSKGKMIEVLAILITEKACLLAIQ